jgi:hypothetical protein
MVTTTVVALLSPLFPQTIELVVENNMSFPKEDAPAYVPGPGHDEYRAYFEHVTRNALPLVNLSDSALKNTKLSPNVAQMLRKL